MPEQEHHDPSAEAGSEQADSYKSLLSDLPGTTDPEANLVHDPEEASAMAEAGDRYRTYAAKKRVEASRTPESVGWGPNKDTHLRNAEANDERAEQLETWAQALYRHPELQGKAFNGEPLTPDVLFRLERDSGELAGMIASVEKRITEIPKIHWSEMSHLYGNGIIDPTVPMGREGRRAEGYVVTGADIHERIAALDSNDATTIGEMRQVVVDAYREAADKLRAKLEPIQGLLEALKN